MHEKSFKIRLLLLALIFAQTINVGFSQSSQWYLIYSNIDGIASFAHPTNTFYKRRSQVIENINFVEVTLVFKESTTTVRFIKNGTFFSEMRVVANSELWPAFATINIMKSAIISTLEDEIKKDPKKYGGLYRFFIANAKKMNGEEMTMFCLYLDYLSR